MNQLQAIDEAVNLLMDYHLRPYFLIEDTESDIDDEIYSHLHKEVKSLSRALSVVKEQIMSQKNSSAAKGEQQWAQTLLP